jgi:DNA-3-methyladenine glycosylase
LCQALGITGAHNSLPLDRSPFKLLRRTAKLGIAVGPRIGISKATTHPWRYGLAGSRFLSRPFNRRK